MVSEARLFAALAKARQNETRACDRLDRPKHGCHCGCSAGGCVSFAGCYPHAATGLRRCRLVVLRGVPPFCGAAFSVLPCARFSRICFACGLAAGWPPAFRSVSLLGFLACRCIPSAFTYPALWRICLWGSTDVCIGVSVLASFRLFAAICGERVRLVIRGVPASVESSRDMVVLAVLSGRQLWTFLSTQRVFQVGILALYTNHQTSDVFSRVLFVHVVLWQSMRSPCPRGALVRGTVSGQCGGVHHKSSVSFSFLFYSFGNGTRNIQKVIDHGWTRRQHQLPLRMGRNIKSNQGSAGSAMRWRTPVGGLGSAGYFVRGIAVDWCRRHSRFFQRLATYPHPS